MRLLLRQNYNLKYLNYKASDIWCVFYYDKTTIWNI